MRAVDLKGSSPSIWLVDHVHLEWGTYQTACHTLISVHYLWGYHGGFEHGIFPTWFAVAAHASVLATFSFVVAWDHGSTSRSISIISDF